MSDRAILRKKLKDTCKTEDDLNEFIFDYFPEVYSNNSGTLSRNDKITNLIEANDIAVINDALIQFAKKNHAHSESEDSSKANDTTILRRELARLKQINKDLETQLAHSRDFPATISPSVGLERISQLFREINDYIDGAPGLTNESWKVFSYYALDTLESALGKYHSISIDFRTRLIIDQQSIDEHFRAPLAAAIIILRTKIDDMGCNKFPIKEIREAFETQPPDERIP